MFDALWDGESFPCLYMAQHLVIGQTLEGKATKSDHLIE